MSAPLLSIVVPCFNEQAVLPETASHLTSTLRSLIDSGAVRAESHIYFVDDGSQDRTWEIIEALSAEASCVHGLKLSRNRGHQNALLAGLFTAEADVVVTIDADLQDDVSAIGDMLRDHERGAAIVYGVRNNRTADPFFKRWSAIAYYRLLRRMGVEIILNHADFRLMNKTAIEALKEYREVNLFLRGIIPQLGFRSSIVTYERTERHAGESKYPLRAMLALATQGVTSFSTVPLRIITVFGLIVSALSCIITLWALIARFVNPNVVPGWASTVIPIYFLGGIQLLGIGVVGEYLAKTYMETKRRPRYDIEKKIGGKYGPINTHRSETAG